MRDKTPSEVIETQRPMFPIDSIGKAMPKASTTAMARNTFFKVFFLISSLWIMKKSGERGIRTPGPSQANGFQDRRNRPLCHLSVMF